MKDITDLKVTQVRLYPIDSVPLRALAIEKNITPFKSILRFKSATLGDEKTELISFTFLNGEYEYQGEVHLVERLIIEPLRLSLSVFGTSSVADALYEEVRTILVAAEPNGSFGSAEPYLKVEETSCVATLDVNFRKLFAAPLLQFLDKTVQRRTSTELASSSVQPMTFSARISYELLNSGLKKAGVQLLDKLLTIEPRIRTTLEEQRYYTFSPTDSETHLKVLREFEKALGGAVK